MKHPLHQFETREQLAETLGAAIIKQLQVALEARGKASMTVSGGNSPKPLFEYLSQQPLAWDKITITLVDERWVSEDSDSSNARLVKSTLLQKQARTAIFIDLYNGMKSPFVAEKSINNALLKIALPIDVVILGMGDDGHTASFFPDARQLKGALIPSDNQRCCGLEPPVALHQRMTLTLPTLLRSEKIYLLVTGNEKISVLQKALEPLSDSSLLTEDGNVRPEINEYPVRSIFHQSNCDVEIYYAD